MPVLAVLASHTPGLRLGTSVVQTYLRDPYVLATETNVIDQLAPGRFRLGRTHVMTSSSRASGSLVMRPSITCGST